MSTPPPPPPPPMGPPPGYQPYGASGNPTNHSKATTALVLGIVGLLCFAPLGILAIVFGIQAKNDIDANPGLYKNRGMAQAGFVLGIVGLALWAFLLIRNFG